jgi:hypothetical protein
LSKVLRSLRPRRPAYDHAAKSVPPIGENQNNMGHDKENKKPHQPEVPDTRFVITAEDRSQPIELHWFVNRPTRENRKKSGDRNVKISDALKCVVFCVEVRMQPGAAGEFGEGEARVVANHLQRITEVGPARQQRAPATPMPSPITKMSPFSMKR